ncbi:MAG: orotidine-5'-phosphate decarboxylase [Acidobacteria bacterium]|nr:orotidine-5'-phosphate decarboxylase [Acidobacteriota bacterium]
MRQAPRLAVALDVDNHAAAVRAAVALRGHADVAKVGLELFISAGPRLVEELVSTGWAVFLDLKLHDIPATVAGAVRSAASLGVELMTLHTAGGRRMLEAAAAARDSGVPRLLGVTVLTSLDSAEIDEVGLRGGTDESVARLANLAYEAGCDGVVSSPHEVATIKAAHGDDFLVVTPGIRPAGASTDDQARVATAADAVGAGADILVVGRPIMKAPDPAAAADAIRAEMEQAHDRRS